MNKKQSLASLIASTDGLSIFGSLDDRNVFKDTLKGILEEDIGIKGVFLANADDSDVNDIIKTDSPHSVVLLSAKLTDHQNISDKFADENKSALRRSPDLVLMGDLCDESVIKDSIELSDTGIKVIGKIQAYDIGSILPCMVRSFPKEQQSSRCYDLIKSTGVLIYETDVGFDVLVLDEAVKADLCDLLTGIYFDPKTMTAAVNDAFLASKTA